METFSQLLPAEKIEAIIATLRRPCPKDIILERAGINVAALDEQTVRGIDAVFQRWAIQPSPDIANALYGVPPERQQEVFARIGVEQKSVHAAIAKVGLTRYGRHKPTL